MNLKDRLQEEMKQAMRERDALKLGVIRYLLAEIKNIEIDAGELSDAEVVKVISRQIKQIKEVLPDYQGAGRNDLFDQESAKVAVLETYLPQQLTDEELEKVISEVMEVTQEKNMGKIIGEVMQKVQGQADGAKVAQLVKEKIS